MFWARRVDGLSHDEYCREITAKIRKELSIEPLYYENKFAMAQHLNASVREGWQQKVPTDEQVAIFGAVYWSSCMDRGILCGKMKGDRGTFQDGSKISARVFFDESLRVEGDVVAFLKRMHASGVLGFQYMSKWHKISSSLIRQREHILA